jgi:hypothetical protein
MSWRHVAFMVAVVTTCCMQRGFAQTVRTIHLKAADARLPEEFTTIEYVRELADGRVLVADGHDNRLVVADFSKGTVQAVSRNGAGPGEFRSVDGLFALGSDSTLLIDQTNRRWLLLVGARIAETLAPDQPAIINASRGEAGADLSDHLLALHPGRTLADPIGRADSLYATLIRRRGGREDTVARIRPPTRRLVSSELGPDGRIQSMRYRAAPFTAFEQFALFPDGWIAIARLDPYRIDWRTPDGRWMYGKPVSDPIVKVDDREKRAWIARAYSHTAVPPDPGTIRDWPATVPPFDGRDDPLVFATPEGVLLLRRATTAASEGTRYDLIDRRGVRTGQVQLAKNEKVIGFGKRSVYVVAIDADDIQRLERHLWP